MLSIKAECGQDMALALKYLSDGRVVAVPTGTVYGLAADALQGYALQRVRNLKHRPADKTFTVFLREDLWPKYFVLSALEQSLLNKFAGRSLTLLVTPRANLSHLAQAGRVGLRQIDHPLMRKIAAKFDRPLTATSANVSGEQACRSASEIHAQFPSEVTPEIYDLSLAYIVDAGLLPDQLPSTIARLDDKKLTVVRAGSVSEAELQDSLIA